MRTIRGAGQPRRRSMALRVSETVSKPTFAALSTKVRSESRCGLFRASGCLESPTNEQRLTPAFVPVPVTRVDRSEIQTRSFRGRPAGAFVNMHQLGNRSFLLDGAGRTIRFARGQGVEWTRNVSLQKRQPPIELARCAMSPRTPSVSTSRVLVDLAIDARKSVQPIALTDNVQQALRKTH
jgi:hypothetical protein